MAAVNCASSSNSSAHAKRWAGVNRKLSLNCASSTASQVTGQESSGLFGGFVIAFDFSQLFNIV